ncbi:uncharacterized protein LOC122263485 [Penaeus japonicus]|uniref:uncharacterized protein LOC122263485 n=1 Tax=Penaeus japonicus TaxID=27405 RepID=UPI001C7147C2|nr:uncharacterized protein LOC122263485 [Penaeus japonicus]
MRKVNFCGVQVLVGMGCLVIGLSNLVLNLTNFGGYLYLAIKDYDHVTRAVSAITAVGALINVTLLWGIKKRNPLYLVSWTTVTSMCSLLNIVIAIVVLYKEVSTAWGIVLLVASFVNFVAVSFIQSVAFEMMRSSA